MKLAKPTPTILYQCMRCKAFHFTLESSLSCCKPVRKRMFAVGRVKEGKTVVEVEGNLSDAKEK
jgi:hypothetical protein